VRGSEPPQDPASEEALSLPRCAHPKTTLGPRPQHSISPRGSQALLNFEMSEVSFSSVDSLFLQLTSHDLRRALLSSSAEVSSKSEAVKQLIADRYPDLLATADEAASMLAGVRSLVQRIENVQTEAAGVIALATAPGSDAAAGISVATAESSEQLRARVDEWLAGAADAVNVAHERGQHASAALHGLAASAALAARGPSWPRHRHTRLLSGLPSASLAICKRVISAALARPSGIGSAETEGAVSRALAAAALGIALLAAAAQSEGVSSKRGSVSSLPSLLPTVVGKALIAPALTAITALLGASGRAELAQRLSSVAAILARTIGAVDCLAAGAVPAAFAAEALLATARESCAAASRGGGGMRDSLDWLSRTSLAPAWRLQAGGEAGQSPFIHVEAALEASAESGGGAGEATVAVTDFTRAVLAACSTAVPALVSTSLGLGEGGVEPSEVHQPFEALRATLAAACGGLEGGRGVRPCLARLLGPLPSLYTALFATSLRSIAGAVVRGALAIHLAEVRVRTAAFAAAAGLAAVSGPLRVYADAAYAADGAAAVAAAARLSPLRKEESAVRGGRVAAVRGALREGGGGTGVTGPADLSIEAQERATALRRSIAEALSSYALLQRARLAHSSFPDSAAGPAMWGASAALLVAAGAAEVGADGSLRPSPSAVRALTSPSSDWLPGGEPPIEGSALLTTALGPLPPGLGKLFDPNAQGSALLRSGSFVGHPFALALGTGALALSAAVVCAVRDCAAEEAAAADEGATASVRGEAILSPSTASATSHLLSSLLDHVRSCVSPPRPGLQAAYEALAAGHVATALASAIPPSWGLAPLVASLGEAGLAASLAWAHAVVAHAGEAAEWGWAAEGAVPGGSATPRADLAAATAASRAWVRTHGDWAPVEEGGGAPAPTGHALSVPASASAPLEAALSRLSAHAVYGGLTDVPAPLPLPVASLLLRQGGGAGTDGPSPFLLAASTELFPAAHRAPLPVTLTVRARLAITAVGVDAARAAGIPTDANPTPGSGGRGVEDAFVRVQLEAWGGPLWPGTVLDTNAEAGRCGLPSPSALAVLLAVRRLRLVTQAALSDGMRRELGRVYGGVAAALTGGEGGGPSYVLEAPLLQAALDVGAWGTLLPVVGLCKGGPGGAEGEEERAPLLAALARCPEPWAALVGGGSGGELASLSASLLRMPAPAFSPGPAALFSTLTAACDPTDWALTRPQLLAFATDTLLAHGMTWAEAAPALAAQAVGRGWMLTLTPPRASSDGPAWSLAAALSSAGGRSGLRAGPPTPSLPFALSTAASPACALLTAPWPLPLKISDLDPATVPALPLATPLPRIPPPPSIATATGAGKSVQWRPSGGATALITGPEFARALAAGAVPGGPSSYVDLSSLLAFGVRGVDLRLPSALASLLVGAAGEGGRGEEGAWEGDAPEGTGGAGVPTPSPAGPPTPAPPASRPRPAGGSSFSSPAAALLGMRGSAAGGKRSSGGVGLTSRIATSLSALGLPITPQGRGGGGWAAALGSASGGRLDGALTRLGLRALFEGEEEEGGPDGEGVDGVPLPPLVAFAGGVRGSPAPAPAPKVVAREGGRYDPLNLGL